MMRLDYRRSHHTVILSDIHLSNAEPPHPKNPLWKRYKSRDFFVDESFARFLKYIQGLIKEPIELILNGDIFDFDSVMTMPDKPPYHVSWLERTRGLHSEEAKSRFKMEVILRDHETFVRALKEFVLGGNKVIFVIGNHDMELHWPGTQAAIRDALGLPADKQEWIRFCEWFYISNQDTLVEHGNQYDAYSLCANPVHPLIKKAGKIYVRIPFGNLANKFMLNGMGLFNPHVPSAYIMSFGEYMRFFFKYLLRTQPLMIWTWFWGAMVTVVYSIGEGLLPAVKDPLTTEVRVLQIATKANASARIVRSLKEIHVHPAHYNPLMILRELWLDRALLFAAICLVSLQFTAVLKFFANVSIFWTIVPLLVLMPFFIFYARSIKSEVEDTNQAPARSVTLSTRLTKVHRVVHGHTHREAHEWIEGVELLNTGTWSPSFHDVECTKPYGKKPFAWIKPGPDGGARVAELRNWTDPDSVVIPVKTGEAK